LQEYLKHNKKLLDAIVLIGANAAGLSDLAMAWLDAEVQLYDWEASDFPCLFEGPLTDANFMSVKALFAKRKNDALRPKHFLALLTDPRTKASKLVEQHRLIGSGDTKDLGNTPAIAEAVKHLQFIAMHVPIHQDGKLLDEKAAAKVMQVQLLVYLEVHLLRSLLLSTASASHGHGDCQSS
jgi:hypothetical protein